MKVIFKYFLIIIFLFLLIIIKNTLEYDLQNREKNKIKHEKKSEQINEIKPNKNNKIIITKGKSKIILTFDNKKDKPPTSIKVNSIIKNNKIDITSNGNLKSSPFEWSIEGKQSELKQMLNSKLNVELSYGNDKKEKNYKIIYK